MDELHKDGVFSSTKQVCDQGIVVESVTEGLLSEKVVIENSECCYGEGVMGSDKCGDDVCMRDLDDGGGGNLSGEVAGSEGGKGLGNDVDEVGGGENLDNEVAVGDLDMRSSENDATISDSKECADTVHVVLTSGGGNEVQKSSEVTELNEEEKLVEGGITVGEVGDVGRDCTVDDSSMLESADAHERGGSKVEGSTGGEVQAVGEKVTVSKVEENLEGGPVDEYVNSGEIRPSANEIEDQRVENGFPTVVSCAEVESGVVAVDKSDSAEMAIDQPRETHGSEKDALHELEVEKNSVFHDEVSEPGIGTTESPSSAVAENSSADIQVVEEKSAGDDDNKSLNPKDGTALEEAHDSDAMKGAIPDYEKDSISSEQIFISNSTPHSLNGHDTENASLDNEEIGGANSEGMDIDIFNDHFCFSVEELQAKFETVNGSTENHYDAFADLQFSEQPAQVVGVEVVVTEDNMLLNSEKDDEQGKPETSHDNTKNHSNVCSDSGNLCHPVQSDQPADITDKVQSDPNFTGSVHMQTDGILCSSGYNQQLKTGAEVEELGMQTTSMDEDEVITSATEVSESAGGDRELKPAEADCNVGSVEVQEQIMHVEQLGQEGDLELHSETAKVSVSKGNVLAASVEGNEPVKLEKGLDENLRLDENHIESDESEDTEAQVHGVDAQQIDLPDGEESEEQDSDSEQPMISDDKSSKLAAAIAHQTSYKLPLDDEGEYNISDLVWGKVRSHPWWPGQIFDPSDASDKAMKYHKKDCFLVAYFGDRTFAWNEASLLKPFRAHFPQVVKQSNSEIFQTAVNCALEEVSRRVEFGLACSCIPRDTYDKLIFQIVENAGIREEASVKDGVDESLSADLLEPAKLVEYLKALAQSPACGADRLELTIATSQLLSFYRLKGYSQLPEFQFCGGLLENMDPVEFDDETTPTNKDEGQSSSGQEILRTKRTYKKRKHNLKDTDNPRKKEKSLSELMVDSCDDSVDEEIGSDGKANDKLVSPTSGKKCRGPDFFPDDSATVEGRKTISLAKVSTPATLPKPSFKIGECIHRVASQMTGSPSILKPNNRKSEGGSDVLVGDKSDDLVQHSEDSDLKKPNASAEYSSLDELLSQLQLVAENPLEGYSFSTVIISFFSDFRNSVIIEKHGKLGGKKRQASNSVGGSETFEFEDMSDTYWTDRVIQNGSEEQPPRKSRKRDTQLVPMDPGKPHSKSNSRKRFSDGNSGLLTEKPAVHVDENAPAELVMHFPVVDAVPSEKNLNKMFRRFGPLREYETETDMDTNRARVVFKKSSDAEAAYGSAPKFNIFGSTLVNYQLNYTVTMPFKTQPVPMLSGEEDEALFLQF